MDVLCAGMFPALQRTLTLASLKPGTVNRVRCVTESVGGKAVNAARVLKALGADPVLFGFAGGENRITIERLLDAEGIPYRLVPTAAPVRLAQTLLADDAPDFTELVEEGPELSGDDWQRFQTAFGTLASEGVHMAVISGSLPAHAPGNAYRDMLAAAGNSIPVILDTSGPPLASALAGKPALVKINAAELLRTTGMEATGSSGRRIEDAAHRLLAAGAQAAGITDGGREAWLVTPARTRRFRIPRVVVASTLGCGDAVNAGTAFALRQSRDIEEAFVFGLACGISNAMHRLPGMVDADAIPALIRQIMIN